MNALQVVQKFYPEVSEVKDATKPLDIEVLSKDINSSSVRNHKACAFAAACKRAKQVDGCIIAIKVAYLIKDGKATRYSVPESLSREIVAFDRDGKFGAGKYRLIRPIRKLGDPAARGSEKRSKPGRKVEYRHITSAIRSMNDAA
jgi:hypothetical protein